MCCWVTFLARIRFPDLTACIASKAALIARVLIASALVGEILAHGIELTQFAWHYRPSLNGRIPLFSEIRR